MENKNNTNDFDKKELELLIKKDTKEKEIAKFFYKNQDKIIEKVNNAILKEKVFIETYEAMMFYIEYYDGKGILTHNFKCENQYISLDTKMENVFRKEVATKRNITLQSIGSYFKTYNEDFWHFGNEVALSIQDKIALDIVKKHIKDYEILGDDLVYSCRVFLDEKTILCNFPFNSNYFGSYKNKTLEEFLSVGEKYAKLYNEECKKTKEEIDEYEFIKEVITKEIKRYSKI